MATTNKQPRKRITYIVINKKIRMGGGESTTIYGPYRSFKRAEGDAKAWEVDGAACSVEPMTKPY